MKLEPSKPRDGPAVEFLPDPFLQLDNQSRSGIANGLSSEILGFGLGLVAGWPDWRASIESSYMQFIERVCHML